MNKGLTIKFIFIITLFAAIIGHSWGERDTGHGTSAQVDLDLRLEVRSYLLLQIGSSGTQVDTVQFLVNDIPENQPLVEGDYQPLVQISSNIGRSFAISLSADSSGGLHGEGGTMPFSIIRWEGTGDLSGSNGTFNGTANQSIFHFPGKGERKGSLRFFYRNTYDYPPGIYQGTVTFTLSAP